MYKLPCVCMKVARIEVTQNFRERVWPHLTNLDKEKLHQSQVQQLEKPTTAAPLTHCCLSGIMGEAGVASPPGGMVVVLTGELLRHGRICTLVTVPVRGSLLTLGGLGA